MPRLPGAGMHTYAVRMAGNRRYNHLQLPQYSNRQSSAEFFDQPQSRKRGTDSANESKKTGLPERQSSLMNSASKRSLDKIYNEIQQVILQRQNPVTGLLPASTAVNAHGDYTDAWVRDNVYSIIAPWALGLAYSRAGDAQKSDELTQATIKLMRGLLQSMMRQANKVEAFKHSLNPLDALHAKYDTATGLSVVADDAWGHLQIDATSIYLLMLAQMTASGLRIVLTYDEVDFVQNLTYYIGSAYRTPDYGIWERGNKINNGKTEINASSLGMAKAALQALDGLNLFGTTGSPRAVVHALPDALSLARTNLAALLPRESLSKEVDSALLSIIGFPAFAVGDSQLANRTRDEILKKLGGNFGLKRFLWDGHQTVIEDPSRLYYEHSELAGFEHIESEWPLFFCYLYINALFSGSKATAKHYREKIESVMIEKNGVRLIPELFYVPTENITAEKQNPNSQPRVANENLPLVWAQSLFYTASLLDEGLLEPADLDPLELRRKTTQFSRAQVALVVLAENDSVKKQLAENGVIAESIEDISPLRVVTAPQLVEVYAALGANPRLSLSGRPKRRLLSLATSQTYTINEQQFLCLSWIQGEQDHDYSQRDARLVTLRLRKEISHIRKHWLNSEVAVFTFMVDARLLQSSGAEELYKCLQAYQLRTADENIGYASASLAYLASRENELFLPGIKTTPLPQREPEIEPAYQWSDKVKTLLDSLQQQTPVEQVATLGSFYQQVMLEDPATKGGIEGSYRDLLQTLHNLALADECWLLVRLTYALASYNKHDLSDYLSVLSARHFSVIVGEDRKSEFGLHPSLTNDEIVEVLRDASSHPIEHCLLQEVLELIGIFQRTRPQLFEGLRSIQLHNLLRLCSNQKGKKAHRDVILEVGAFTPSQLLEKIASILETLHSRFASGVRKGPVTDTSVLASHDAVDMDWFEWRFERGMILGLTREFLEQIWKTLAIAPKLIFGDANNTACVIDSEFVRKSMTSGEEIFAQLIDNALTQLHPPYFKSALIEVLHCLINFHHNHPSLVLSGPVNLGEILEAAAKLYSAEEHQTSPSVRDVDLLLEESPEKVAGYINKVLLSVSEQLMARPA